MTKTDDVKCEREILRMALNACHAFIKWERSSLEHGKPRDTKLLVDAMVKCHRAVMAEKEASNDDDD